MDIELGRTYIDGWGQRHCIAGETHPQRCVTTREGEHDACAFWSRSGNHYTRDGRMIGRLNADCYALQREDESEG